MDWVGRVESVEEDLAELVDLLNARPGVPKLRSPRPGQLGRVNVNTGACQQGAGAGASGGLFAAAGGWLGRRRLAAAAPTPSAEEEHAASPSSSSDWAAEPQPGPGQNGSSSVRMKLPPEEWEPRSGTLNLCDKNDMLRGRYRHCYDALTEFYAEDMRLLHGR